MVVDNNSIFMDLLRGAGVLLIAAISWILNRVHTRLIEVERAMVELGNSAVKKDEFGDLKRKVGDKVGKAEFNEYLARSETTRTELRNGQISLFEKIDQLKDLMIQLFQGKPGQ